MCLMPEQPEQPDPEMLLKRIEIFEKDRLLEYVDLSTLNGRQFLDDCALHACMLLDRSAWTQDNRDRVLLASPMEAKMVELGSSKDQTVDNVERWDLDSKDLALFPVSDAKHAYSAGTHWSLLVLQPKRQAFTHVNSLVFSAPRDDHCVSVAPPPEPHENAFELARRIAAVCGYAAASFAEARARQQKNGYDCGLFVAANAERAAEALLFYGKDALDTEDTVAQEDIWMKRLSFKRTFGMMLSAKSSMLEQKIGKIKEEKQEEKENVSLNDQVLNHSVARLSLLALLLCLIHLILSPSVERAE